MGSLDIIRDPAKDADVDIILVHGLEGDSQSTWTYEATGLFWPRSLLPEDFPTARILVFSYPASFSYFFPESARAKKRHKSTPGAYTEDLIDALSQLRKSSHTENRQMIFIAHGLGGLLSAELIASSNENISSSIKGIVFLGTPFGDEQDESSWGTIARAYHSFLLRADPADSTPAPDGVAAAAQSGNARRIMKDFKAVTGQREDNYQPLQMAFLLPRSGVINSDGHELMVVEPDYAVLEEYDGSVVPGDQVSMTKIPDRESPGYQAICSAIRGWIEAGTAQIPWITELAMPQDTWLYDDFIQYNTAVGLDYHFSGSFTNGFRF
ncbi:hypothetical protein BJX64DRAFT_290684 [Aspergillus heterothallicus]